MPTFIALVPYFKNDGSARIIFKVTHKRKRRYLSSNIYAYKKDLTREGHFKGSIKNSLTEEILAYQKKCNNLGSAINEMTVDDVVNYIEVSAITYIDFIKFGQKMADEFERHGKEGTAGNMRCALNSMMRFTGADSFDINNLTYKFLKDYEKWLKKVPAISNKKDDVTPISGRAISLYIGEFRKILNIAKETYNDDDRDIHIIKVSPFPKFKIEKPEDTEKRALTADQIRKIMVIPDEPVLIRQNLARDIYMLSFYLVGMNSIDFYHCTDLDDGIITYMRRKTTGRRSDNALMRMRIEPEAKALMEKYRDPSGHRIFDFYKRYADASIFNNALNIGLKKIGEYIKEPGLTFYSARHSWATIAVNDCDVDRYKVHEALNHVDEKMKVTDIYVKKDFSRIWRINRQVLEFLNQKLVITAHR